MTAAYDSDTLTYQEGFLPAAEANEALRRLWTELSWSQRPIRLFGRRVKQPRLIAWHGEPEATYRYSGITLEPAPWHDILLRLRDQLQQKLHCRFNSVLANAYRDGCDSMGWHADDESELGPQPTVASISLGAARRFLLKHRQSGQLSKIELRHGSLLVMNNDCQRRYRHAVPKTRLRVGLRINLTYRFIVAPKKILS